MVVTTVCATADKLRTRESAKAAEQKMFGYFMIASWSGTGAVRDADFESVEYAAEARTHTMPVGTLEAINEVVKRRMAP
jgi:hypothetical protein